MSTPRPEYLHSELSNQAVKFIKIDVQGYELPVCLGMENTLLANPDLIVVLEYMPASMSELGFVPEALLNFFQDRDYFIYILQQRGNLETANDGIIHSMLKKREYIDLVCSRKKLM